MTVHVTDDAQHEFHWLHEDEQTPNKQQPHLLFRMSLMESKNADEHRRSKDNLAAS